MTARCAAAAVAIGVLMASGVDAVFAQSSNPAPWVLRNGADKMGPFASRTACENTRLNLVAIGMSSSAWCQFDSGDNKPPSGADLIGNMLTAGMLARPDLAPTILGGTLAVGLLNAMAGNAEQKAAEEARRQAIERAERAEAEAERLRIAEAKARKDAETAQFLLNNMKGVSDSTTLALKGGGTGAVLGLKLGDRHDVVAAPGSPIDSPDVEVPIVTRDVDSLLIGGTGWVYGYYAPRRGDKRIQEEELKKLEKQWSLAPGMSREKFTDPRQYDMIIALALRQDEFYDLLHRVIPDEFTEGAATPEGQRLFASLKDTRVSHLDCHSNGAMVCLAALEMQYVRKKGDRLDVRLFGPQLTPDAVKSWRKLLSNHVIDSLEIDMTEGDPIAPASYAFAEGPLRFVSAELPMAAAAFLWRGRVDVTRLDIGNASAVHNLQRAVAADAPEFSFKIFKDAGCWERADTKGESWACHDFKLYRSLRDRN